jgi:hypothetical protein
MMMKPSSNAQSAIQKNLNVSLVLPTTQQETTPVEIKVQPLPQSPVLVAHVPHTISLAPPDDFPKNPMIYILLVAANMPHGKQACFLRN